MGLRLHQPVVVGFLLFTLIPMIATFVFTFTNINLIQDKPLQFVGLKNYQHLFADPRLGRAPGHVQVRRVRPAHRLLIHSRWRCC